MDLRIFAFVMIEVSALCPRGYKYEEFYNECIPTKPLTLLMLQIKQSRVKINDNVIKEEETASSDKDVDLVAYPMTANEDKRNTRPRGIKIHKCPEGLKFDEIIQACIKPILRYIQNAFKDCALCNLKDTKPSSKLRKPKADESNAVNLVDLFDIPLVVANDKLKSEDALSNIINKVWIR